MWAYVRSWQVYAQREKQRLQQEQEEASKFPFQPKKASLNQSTQSEPTRQRSPGKAVSDRLHEEAKRRQKERLDAKRALDEAEVASHPFKPSINKDSKSLLDMREYKPLHERITDLQRAKVRQWHLIDGTCSLRCAGE